MQRILMNISGVFVEVTSEWIEITEVLVKDFWGFRITSEDYHSKIDFKLHIEKTSQAPKFPEMPSSMQTQNAITYDIGQKRYCDYYGELWSEIDFKFNEAKISSINYEKTHEVAYLLILSRVGKILDLRGIHKLHAFAIELNNQAIVCMMPSKGGKSTLLLELLKDPRVKMISDDIPLITQNGEVLPFPLKLGLSEFPEGIKINFPEENIYKMQRTHHGEKILVSVRGIEEKVTTRKSFNDVILIEAFRFHSESSRLVKANTLDLAKGLIKHGIIGIGSPIIFEYFWQSGIADFFRKTKIFFLRVRGFYSLSRRASKYMLYSGSRPSETAKMILNYPWR